MFKDEIVQALVDRHESLKYNPNMETVKDRNVLLNLCQASPHIMRIPHIIILNAVVLVAALAASCSKSPSGQAADGHNPRSVSELPANLITKELGVVEFSAQTPKLFTLGANTNCVITPTILPGGMLQMEIAVETKSADGQTTRLGQSRITQRSGQPCGISVGGMMISLTPKLKAE